MDELETVVVLNTALDRGDRRSLTDFVLAPHRSPFPAYDKQHLYENERTVFVAGSHGFSFEVGSAEIGLSVCYDANFPEHAASAVAKSATVITGGWTRHSRQR